MSVATEYFAVDTGTSAVVAKVDTLTTPVSPTQVVVAYEYETTEHPGLTAAHLCYYDSSLGDMRPPFTMEEY